MVMVHIQLKRIECSNMVVNILPADPPTPYPHNPSPLPPQSLPDPGDGVKSQNRTFSEHDHVVYQIR